MAKASEQFRQTDVTTWAIVALVFGGLAVVGSNISAIIPTSLLAGLHKTRLEGASLDQLRTDVAALRAESRRIKQDNVELAARFALQERTGGEVVRRVGALEGSIPRLLEAIPATAEVDRSNLTAAIGGKQSLVYEADGGSVVVRQQTMPLALPSVPPTQPLPDQLTASLETPTPESGYGVALGSPVTSQTASAAWGDISLKLGSLLFGMVPLVTNQNAGVAQRIVVGPITELSEATALCTRLERVSIACTPMPFLGTPLLN